MRTDDSSIPARLGRYQICGHLGEGGMGSVLEAYDPDLDRPVALKVLHRHLDLRKVTRLEREAQALAKLSHPNVVQVYEVGQADGRSFVAMERVQGRTVRQWLRQVPRPGWRACVEVFMQLGEGLAAAHEQGLVHRDFKPSNAIVDDKGRARVLDFGLVRQVDEALDESSSEVPTITDDERDGPGAHGTLGDSVELEASVERIDAEGSALATPLTRTGSMMGTPPYMPLEQLLGRPADARSDQFSFCVALYEALYGERPYEGTSALALMVSLREEQLRPAPRGTKVPAAVRAIVRRGLAAHPDQRWPSMTALLEALRRQVAPRGRRVLAVAVAGGLTAVGVGLAVGQYAQVHERCTGSEEHIAAVWGPASRARVEAAILGTELSFAADTWDRVSSGLDDYARAWSLEHQEVCEATRVRQEQSEPVMDLRMQCLRQRLVALRETVAVLAEGDRSRVSRATQLVGKLPALARCDDVEALAAELPPPEDPAVAQRVQEQRERLQRAHALWYAGDYDRGLAEADGVVAEAEALGYAPLLAEASMRRGTLYDELARYDEAERDLERAFTLATEHGHHRVAAHAIAWWTWVVGLRQSRAEQGLWLAKVALPLARAPGRDLAAVAHIEGIVGTVLQVRAEYDQALEHLRRSAAIREQVGGPDSVDVAVSLLNLANVLQDQGQFEQSLTHLRRALAIRERAQGPRHPDIALILANIGIALEEQAKYDEALPVYERALSINEEVRGATHPEIAYARANLGALLYRTSRLEEALAQHRQALGILEEALGPDDPNLAISLNNVGLTLKDLGRLDEALPPLERAAAIFEAALGPEHPNVASPLDNLGLVYKAQGQLSEARRYLERALAIRREALGPEHPAVAGSLGNLGSVLELMGDRAGAQEHLERSVAIFEKSLGPEHPAVGESRLGLSSLALALGHDDVAREHAERAVAIGESSDVPSLLARARWALALALTGDPTQRGRARVLAEQALAGFEGLGAGHDQERQAVKDWLRGRASG